MHLEHLLKVLNIFWKFWNGSEVGNPVDQVTPALISAGALAKGVAVIVSNKLEQIRQRENAQNAKLSTVSHFYCERSARRTVQFSCITDLKTRGRERWSISQQRSGKPKTIECQPLCKRFFTSSFWCNLNWLYLCKALKTELNMTETKDQNFVSLSLNNVESTWWVHSPLSSVSQPGLKSSVDSKIHFFLHRFAFCHSSFSVEVERT